MTVTFNRVTAAGNTTFQTSNTGFPTAPCAAGRPDASGRQVLPGPTTATTTGNTTVCLNYTNLGTTGEAGFQVYRYNGTSWSNITGTRSTANNNVCGAATGAGIYAITTF